MSFTVNAPESSFTLDLAGAAVAVPRLELSPIDAFYEDRKRSLALASSPILNTDEMRALALIPVFAGAEMYFRRFIARAIEVCPLCEEIAGTQQIALGAFAALGKSEMSFAIAEHQGFTSEGEIPRRTNKVLGIDLNRSSSVRAAVADFESLCHLRHAIVHCGGDLMYLNRRQLGITEVGRLQVRVDVAAFQGVILKVSNLVRSYNSHVGLELAKRWFREGHVGASWQKDRVKFKKLIDALWSSTDMSTLPDYKVLYLEAGPSV
ncbi:MAG: hypothetical protein ACJ8GV_05375 [Luteimonas sp.]